MRFILTSILTLVAANFVGANPISIDLPHGVKPQSAGSRSLDSAKPIVGRMTNAKRFAMGLPPLKPKALHRGTRAASARRASTSITPTPDNNHHCNILVKNADDPSVTYGFISPVFNAFSGYGLFQATQAGALEVSFYASFDVLSSGQLDLQADNGPSSTYPYFGAADVFASSDGNLAPGSYKYAFLSGTKQTPRGSPAVNGDSSLSTATGIPAGYESAIWQYNALTEEISARWINTDGSGATTYLLYAEDGDGHGNGAILLNGDPSALNTAAGTSYPTLTFTCVPALPAP